MCVGNLESSQHERRVNSCQQTIIHDKFGSPSMRAQRCCGITANDNNLGGLLPESFTDQKVLGELLCPRSVKLLPSSICLAEPVYDNAGCIRLANTGLRVQ